MVQGVGIAAEKKGRRGSKNVQWSDPSVNLENQRLCFSCCCKSRNKDWSTQC